MTAPVLHASTPMLVVGSLAFDDLEMPSGSFHDVLGGAAMYSAIAASLLSTPVRLVGVVGDDFAESHFGMLRERGVDTSGVERAKGRTFRWKGRYSSDLASRETLETQLNVFADFQPKIPEAFRTSPIVLLGNIHPRLQLNVLDQVRSPALVVADTMNFWISGEPDLLAKVLERIDLLVINDEEVRQLAGTHNVPKAAREVRARGPKRLIVKRGEHGALLFDEQGTFFVPGYPLENVVDPTGAGDSFAGGLLGYLARHGELSPAALRRAMFFASAVASFCVEGIGPRQLLLARRADLVHRIDGFARMVDYGGALAFTD